MFFHKDEGSQYLKKLGLKGAKSGHGIWTNFVRKFGRDQAEDFLDRIRFYQDHNDIKGLYEFKNSDYEKGLFYTGLIDADIIRKACNWLADNKRYFGKTILEIGCDVGIISCYLGALFPQAEITSIDRGENSIRVAEKLAGTLGIKNVRFLHSDLNQLSNNKYDTVFSMRTIHENSKASINELSGLTRMSQGMRKGIDSYINRISSFVAEGGNIITIERCEIDPFFLAYLYSFNDHGFVCNNESHETLICDEAGINSQFQIAVLQAGKWTEQEVYDFWGSSFGAKTSSGIVYGWEADYILEEIQDKKLTRAIQVVDRKTLIGWLELYEVGDQLYYYWIDGTSGVHKMIIGPEMMREQYVQQIDSQAKQYRDIGYTVKNVK